MVGWHHWLKGHEFEQAPGDSVGQGSLVCCSPWGRKESGMTKQLKNNKCGDMEVHCMITSTRQRLEIFIIKRKNLKKKAFPMWDEAGLTYGMPWYTHGLGGARKSSNSKHHLLIMSQRASDHRSLTMVLFVVCCLEILNTCLLKSGTIYVMLKFSLEETNYSYSKYEWRC